MENSLLIYAGTNTQPFPDPSSGLWYLPWGRNRHDFSTLPPWVAGVEFQERGDMKLETFCFYSSLLIRRTETFSQEYYILNIGPQSFSPIGWRIHNRNKNPKCSRQPFCLTYCNKSRTVTKRQLNTTAPHQVPEPKLGHFSQLEKKTLYSKNWLYLKTNFRSWSLRTLSKTMTDMESKKEALWFPKRHKIDDRPNNLAKRIRGKES